MRGSKLFVVPIGCLAGMLAVVLFSQERDAGPASVAERAVRLSTDQGRRRINAAEIAERIRSGGRFATSDAVTLPRNEPERKRIPVTRQWFDNLGELAFTGTFVTYQSGDVTLRNPAGRVQVVSFNSLSEPCKAFVNYKVNGSNSVREPELLIYALLSNKNHRVRRSKALQLGNAKENHRETVVVALAKALEDVSPDVQIAAINSLARFRDESVLPDLERLAGSNNQDVAEVATNAIRVIHGLPEPSDEPVNLVDREMISASNNAIQLDVGRWIENNIQDVRRFEEYEEGHQKLLNILEAIDEQDPLLLQQSLARLMNIPLPNDKDSLPLLLETLQTNRVDSIRRLIERQADQRTRSVDVVMVGHLLRDAGAGEYQLALGGQNLSLGMVIQRTIDGIFSERLVWTEYVLSGDIRKVVTAEALDREPTPEEVVWQQTRRFSPRPEFRAVFTQLLLLREITVAAPVTN
jgi:hypothetical protein